MKIILKTDYGLLGSAGEVVEVKGGYARNFLIPRGIGKVANKANIKAIEEVRKQQGRKIDKEVEDAKKVAAEIGKVELSIGVKTGEDGKIFGSVTSQMILDKLIEKGVDTVDRRKILLPHPLKVLGEHPVSIKIYGDVLAELKVNIVREMTKEEIEAEEKRAQERKDAKKKAEEMKAKEKEAAEEAAAEEGAEKTVEGEAQDEAKPVKKVKAEDKKEAKSEDNAKGKAEKKKDKDSKEKPVEESKESTEERAKEE